jgi:hypothetical protein
MSRLHYSVPTICAILAAGTAHAQLPSGADINSAIPIYYNQVVQNLGDVKTAPFFVYSIAAAKGQTISVTISVATTAVPNTATMAIVLFGPSATTIGNCTVYGSSCPGNIASAAGGGHSDSFTYTASTAGVYYIDVVLGSQSVNYTLEVTTTGTIPVTPNPTQAGCLTGQVNSISYSLQLIAAGLPDTVTIGTTQMCPTCAQKAPSNADIVAKMEKAMSLNLPVSACYDSGGNVFQITLNHQ